MVVMAMLVTMLPVTASASVPDRDSGAVFKNMYMHRNTKLKNKLNA